MMSIANISRYTEFLPVLPLDLYDGYMGQISNVGDKSKFFNNDTSLKLDANDL